MVWKEFGNRLFRKEGIEGDLVKTVFISLLTSFITFGVLYFTKLRYFEDLIPKYGFYLFFAILSYSLILPSIVHVRAYKNFPCMSGMMIGMTIGMIGGFLSGFYTGATNGMFWGSLFGMTIGVLFGAWNGRCCGIMGVLEGVMAGFMGGLMGAMTSLMMLNDKLKAIGVIVFIISSFIIFGLNFMIYTETRGAERRHKDDAFFTIVWSIILTIFTVWLMVFGPRSLLLQ